MLTLLVLAQYIFYLFLTICVFLIGLRLGLQPVTGVCKCRTKLRGNVALVTGGNSGIGLETARDLARRGARVIIASRDVNKSAEAVHDIIETTGNHNVEYRYLDLSKFKSIREFAEEFNKNEDRLDILVNNAGVSGLKYTTTEDHIDMLMQINYFGPVLLTNLLLNKLTQSAPSRIVSVTSNMYRLAFMELSNLKGNDVKSHLIRYSNSKLCTLLWTKELARRLPEGVTAYCLHPGVVNTNIYANMDRVSRTILCALIKLLFKTPEQGAQTIIHLCVAPNIEGTTGGYYDECKLRSLSGQARKIELAEEVYNKTMVILNHSE